MLSVAWLLASALSVADDIRRPEPEIRAAGGEVTIRAQNLPLSQILDRLSTATGMALTYEGTRPTTPITVSVEGVSEAEAILKLMEGLGVSYVFRTDSTGQRVAPRSLSGSGAATLVAAALRRHRPYQSRCRLKGNIPLDSAVLEAGRGRSRRPTSTTVPGAAAQTSRQRCRGRSRWYDPGSSQGGRNPPPRPRRLPHGVSYPSRSQGPPPRLLRARVHGAAARNARRTPEARTHAA